MFRYGVCYLAVPLSAWRPGTIARWLSIDRRNVLTLRSRDYGDGTGTPHAWIRAILDTHGLPEADGEIIVLTLPRFLGYAFNPVSFWFCLDQQGALRAVLADVSNTFGERHRYLCHHDDRRPILGNEWLEVRKIFHVSPFMEVKGSYRFRFDLADGHVAVVINLHDEEGLILATSIAGTRTPITALALWRSLFDYPLQTLKVVALIHFQAARLFLKGVRNYRKPAPPSIPVSR